jgi:hypothetical protein
MKSNRFTEQEKAQFLREARNHFYRAHDADLAAELMHAMDRAMQRGAWKDLRAVWQDIRERERPMLADQIAYRGYADVIRGLGKEEVQ